MEPVAKKIACNPYVALTITGGFAMMLISVMQPSAAILCFIELILFIIALACQAGIFVTLIILADGIYR